MDRRNRNVEGIFPGMRRHSSLVHQPGGELAGGVGDRQQRDTLSQAQPLSSSVLVT